jgi:methanogenic corrinoid protein MtbC1
MRDEELFSVGQVSTFTGILPDTLRVWERRYGMPTPVRLPSGHRRYTADQLAHLRRVAEALALGHRAGELVPRSAEELDGLIAASSRARPVDPDLASRIDEVREMRVGALVEALDAAFRDLGTLEALEQRVAPLLVEIGRRWAEGEIDVRHEHLASQAIDDHLRSVRLRVASRRRTAPRGSVLMATLPGERHGLGMQMAALVAEERGIWARVLGTGCPPGEILDAAMEVDADAVAVSVSLSTGGVRTDRMLSRLRDRLPESISLVVGGTGARAGRRGPARLEYCTTLAELDAWLGGLCGDAGPAVGP